MKIRKVLCIMVAICSLTIPGKSQNNSANEPVLMKIGDSQYTLDEFDYYFLKNTERPDAEKAKSAINEYLELFINFKLKVKEALTLKMDEDPAFIQEFNGYRDQLIEPFLSTSKANEELIVEAYDRLQFEVAGTHILINSASSNTPEDTLAAYNQILDYKKRIENGEDMGELAKKYSHDRSAANNKGYLGYFTSMQMVYPFENAAYGGKVGDVIGPFKTRFGYHILRIDDKRPARGQAKAAHIMIRSEADSSSQQKAEKKINSIYESLQEDKDWGELCKLYSDDKNTSSKNGELKWFGTGQLVPEFEDVAFSMDSIGSISKPVKTRFGWHIIKLLDKKPLPSLDEQRADIEKRISKDSRTSVKKTTAYSLIKSKYNYSKDDAGLKVAFSAIDSTLLVASWNLDSTSVDGQKTIFTLDDKTFSSIQFWKYVIENQKKRKTTPLQEYIQYLYNQFEETSIFDYEKEIILETNVDYQMILDEYKSGILLFNLMEKMVWNKAIQDTAGLKLFYESQKNNYPLAPHMKVRKLVLSDTTQLTRLLGNLTMTNSQLDSMFNSVEPLTLQADEKTVFKGDHSFLDSNWQIGNHVEKRESTVIVWPVNEIKGKGFQALTSIKGKVISDYQQDLEREWIKTLKKKYPVKVTKPVLKYYIKSFE